MILPYDYGLGLIRSSTTSFRREIVRRCHGRALSDVAWEYDITYTTLETCIEKLDTAIRIYLKYDVVFRNNKELLEVIQ